MDKTIKLFCYLLTGDSAEEIVFCPVIQAFEKKFLKHGWKNGLADKFLIKQFVQQQISALAKPSEYVLLFC